MKSSEQLVKLEQQIDTLNKKKITLQKRAKNLRESVTRSKRKETTRRLILTGITINEAIKDGHLSSDQIELWMDSYIKKDNDRKFLGLT